jgi:hypothetical protein
MNDPFRETRSTRRDTAAQAIHSRCRRPDLRPFARQPRCRGVLRLVASAWLICLSGSAALAEPDAKEQMQSLDEQVQEIKSDVLSIAAELTQLEEKLLYPSNTQLSVFVSLAEGELARLDSVEIQVDGQPVAHHIYTFKELEALQKGGVQRIYTGNVPTGDHQLEVSVLGKLASGREFDGSSRFSFRKEVEPKLVGITLSGLGSAASGIQLAEW